MLLILPDLKALQGRANYYVHIVQAVACDWHGSSGGEEKTSAWVLAAGRSATFH